MLTGYVDRIAINQAIADARREQHRAGHHRRLPAPGQRALRALRDPRRRAGRYPTVRGKKPLTAAYQRAVVGHPQVPPRRSPARPPRPSTARLKKQWLKVMATTSGAPSRWPRRARPARSPTTTRPTRSGRDARLRQARPHVRQGRPDRLREQPPVVDSALVDRERFTEHLAAPNGRGVVLSGGHDGHAGGAVCGDLIRVSVRVEGDRVTAAGFDAVGLRRADRGRLGRRDAGRGRAAARRRARGHARDRRRARRALARASCTPPI